MSPSHICQNLERPGGRGLGSSRAVLTTTNSGRDHGDATVWMCTDTGSCHPAASRTDRGPISIAWRGEGELVLDTQSEGLILLPPPRETRFDWPIIKIEPTDPASHPPQFCSTVLDFRRDAFGSR